MKGGSRLNNLWGRLTSEGGRAIGIYLVLVVEVAILVMKVFGWGSN